MHAMSYKCGSDKVSGEVWVKEMEWETTINLNPAVHQVFLRVSNPGDIIIISTLDIAMGDLGIGCPQMMTCWRYFRTGVTKNSVLHKYKKVSVSVSSPINYNTILQTGYFLQSVSILT